MRTWKFKLGAAALAVAFWILPSFVLAQREMAQVATAVARLLEQHHFTRQKLDANLSEKFFDHYLRVLDPNRLYFLASDIEEFRTRYGRSLHEYLLRGDVSPALEIFSRFQQRVEARVAKNLKWIEEPFDFSSKRTVELDRKNSPWPANEKEADRLWRARIEGEMLQEQLAEARIDSPQTVLTRRYNQVLRSVQEQETNDIISTFLSSLAQTYDPHSDYMSPHDMENFAISMRLSLVGVGAVLRSDEGYARVIEIVPGGPADRDGRLKVNDRIAAVAQGDGPFEDTVGMKLDKVVEKIRGKKGTKVRLLVIPAGATDSSQRKVIEIVRDEVQLKDQEAKAELIILPEEGGKGEVRLGWISIPSFYSSSIDPTGRNNPRKSTTDDVSLLLRRLIQEGIDGLVIDLRKDGGGSLEEAINLTGLFIPKGPVVQVKDANGRVTVHEDRDERTLYNGPLIVVINRLSASASEIFAAALQDYGRAIVVGDSRSFGKGTVQQVVDVSKFMPLFSMLSSNAGSLKLTVQKFYRVKGGSTQLRGVESDIVLPSLTDSPEIGESALTNPLPYDEVAPRPIVEFANSPRIFLKELQERSANRVALEPEFRYIREDMERLRQRIAANSLSLNLKERKAEKEADKLREEKRKAERLARGPALNAQAFELTVENANAPQLVAVDFDRPNKKSTAEEGDDSFEGSGKQADANSPPVPDAIRNETLLIARDLVELSNQRGRAKTAQN